MKKMNNVVLAAVFAAGVMVQGAAMAQTSNVPLKDDLFAGTEVFAKNATDVTEISMNPDSLDRVGGNHANRARQELLHVVREYSYDKPGMYDMAEVDKFRAKLDTGDWHCSVHERHLKTGSSTDVCAKHRTDDLKETAIIEVEPKELTFIHMIVKNAPGEQGESTGMMWMGSMSGLTALSSLDPDMIQLKYQLNGLKYQLGAMPMMMDLNVMPQIDSEAIQQSIEKAQKDWDKSGAKLKDKVKEFSSPDGSHTIVIAPDAAVAPEVAPAAPAPQAQPAPLPQ